MTWALRLLRSRVVQIAAAAGLGFLLAVVVPVVREWREGQAVATTPEIAERVKPAKRWKRPRLAREIQVPEVPAPEAARVAERFGRPDLRPGVGSAGSGAAGVPAGSISSSAPPAPEILDVVADERPAPAGVEVLTTLQPDGSVESTVRPLPEPVFRAPLRWEVSGEGLWNERLELDRVAGELALLVAQTGAVSYRAKLEVAREAIPGAPGRWHTPIRGGARVTWGKR